MSHVVVSERLPPSSDSKTSFKVVYTSILWIALGTDEIWSSQATSEANGTTVSSKRTITTKATKYRRKKNIYRSFF